MHINNDGTITTYYEPEVINKVNDAYMRVKLILDKLEKVTHKLNNEIMQWRLENDFDSFLTPLWQLSIDRNNKYITIDNTARYHYFTNLAIFSTQEKAMECYHYLMPTFVEYINAAQSCW
jgi:hypothetical protein